MDTRECPNPDCDAEIGTTETECPKCKVNIAEMDEQIQTVARVNRAIKKRRQKEEEKRARDNPQPVTQPEPKKRSFLENLIPRNKGE